MVSAMNRQMEDFIARGAVTSFCIFRFPVNRGSLRKYAHPGFAAMQAFRAIRTINPRPAIYFWHFPVYLLGGEDYDSWLFASAGKGC